VTTIRQTIHHTVPLIFQQTVHLAIRRQHGHQQNIQITMTNISPSTAGRMTENGINAQIAIPTRPTILYLPVSLAIPIRKRILNTTEWEAISIRMQPAWHATLQEMHRVHLTMPIRTFHLQEHISRWIVLSVMRQGMMAHQRNVRLVICPIITNPATLTTFPLAYLQTV